VDWAKITLYLASPLGCILEDGRYFSLVATWGRWEIVYTALKSDVNRGIHLIQFRAIDGDSSTVFLCCVCLLCCVRLTLLYIVYVVDVVVLTFSPVLPSMCLLVKLGRKAIVYLC
jgi:hypothetical protein